MHMYIYIHIWYSRVGHDSAKCTLDLPNHGPKVHTDSPFASPVKLAR